MSVHTYPFKTIFFAGIAALLICVFLSGCALSDVSNFFQTLSDASAGVQSESSEDQLDLVQDEEAFILIEEVIVLLLFIAALVGIAARRFRVPYTLGLVVIGLIITLFPQVNITIQPTLIFALLIPPIVFEAAFHLNVNDLRRDIVPILIFAIPGVILTMGVVGVLVSWGTGIPIIYTRLRSYRCCN